MQLRHPCLGHYGRSPDGGVVFQPHPFVPPSARCKFRPSGFIDGNVAEYLLTWTTGPLSGGYVAYVPLGPTETGNPDWTVYTTLEEVP